jgi:hypothetical protein
VMVPTRSGSPTMRPRIRSLSPTRACIRVSRSQARRAHQTDSPPLAASPRAPHTRRCSAWSAGDGTLRAVANMPAHSGFGNPRRDSCNQVVEVTITGSMRHRFLSP